MIKTFNQLKEEDAPNIHKIMSTEEKRLRSVLINKDLKRGRVIQLSDISTKEMSEGIDTSPI